MIPMGVTEDNYLVCIPTKEDGPVKLVVGKQGYGMSYALLNIARQVYHVWGDKVCMLNDSLDQFGRDD